MENQHIAKSWISFRKACDLEGAPSDQLREMRRAFFGGAVTVFQIVASLGSDKYTESEGIKVMESLNREIKAYNREIQASIHRSN